MINRVLAVGAHPDDVEFIAGGTLTLLSKAGVKVYIATICTGDMGSMTRGPREIAQVRFREASQSAEIIGATYESLGESDLKLTFNNSTRMKVVELVRRVKPDVVFTHYPRDYMPDHQITADLVWDACFNAPIPNYYTNQPNPSDPIDKIPYLFYGDGIEGLDRFGSRVSVEFYVDISSVIEIKEEMLKRHESQRSWLKAQHGMDQYILTMRRWSSERGKEVNVEFAEGFIQHKGHPFPRDNILEKILPVIYPRKK